MQMSIGLDRLKRFVCLLLIFVLLFCFFMCPRASAVAVEATTVAYAGLLVGTLLVGAGVAFSNPGDMAKAGNAMYRTLQKGNEAIASKIAAISAWAVDHGKSIGSAALRIGKDLYQGILDAFNASYSDGKFNIAGGVVTLADGANKASCVAAAGAIKDLLVLKQDCTLFFDFYDDYGAYRKHCMWFYNFSYGATGLTVRIVDSGGKVISNSTYPYSDRNAAYWEVEDSGCDIVGSHSVSTLSFCNGTGSGWNFSFYTPFSVSYADGVAIPKPDLKYPSDDYLVKMPDIPSVDSATGAVTYPDSIAYTKDAVAAPYPIGDDGVKVPDIPFDIPVDQTSGKPMDDTGTDTDTPSKPGEGTDTDKPNVNWPSAGDISLPKLIISKFPFCIPFDVARLIGLLEADPKTPIFHVPLKVGTILNEEIVLDLSQWDNAVRIIRWGELLVFVAGLVLVTRNYIKW